MKSSIFGLAAAAILLSACGSKDKDAAPQSWYLTETLAYDTDDDKSDTAITQFRYTSGRISEILEIQVNEQGRDTSVAKVAYSNGRLSAFSYPESDYEMTFEYKGDQLAFVYETDGNNSRSDSLAYNAQGKVSACYNAAGTQVIKATWEGNNVKSYTRYNIVGGVEIETSSTTFTYNSQPSSYKLFTDNLFWKIDVSAFETLSANNITKEVFTLAGGAGGETITYEYVYDSNNMLTEIITTETGLNYTSKRNTKLKYSKF